MSTKQSPHHSFQRVKIQYPDKYAIETCTHCGVESKRYNGAASRQYKVDGKWQAKAPECGSDLPAAGVVLVRDHGHGDHFLKAYLFDAKVIINLLLDDLQAAGIDTTSSRMARVYLGVHRVKVF